MSKDRPAWADAGRRSDDNIPPRPHIPDSMMDQRFRNMRCRRTGRCQSARRKAELGNGGWDVRCGRECGAVFSILFFFFFSARVGVASKRVVTAVQSQSSGGQETAAVPSLSLAHSLSPHGPHTLSLGAVTHTLSLLCTVSETRRRNLRAFDTLSYFSSD